MVTLGKVVRRREYQLLRCTCEQDHPMARFGSGSYKTLHDDPAGEDRMTVTCITCYSCPVLMLVLACGVVVPAAGTDGWWGGMVVLGRVVWRVVQLY